MDPRNPMAAMRSGSLLHVDEEISTAFQEAYKEEHPTEEDPDFHATQQIATLDQHPGFQILRDKFMQRIEAYRSGLALSDELANYNLSDAQIGQMTRNMHLIAGELTAFLNEVALAVDEVEKHKQESRDATQQRLGRRT